MRSLTLAALCLCAAAGFASGATAQPHPFTVRDLLAMDRITDPQASPKGDRVAFVVRTTDLDNNRGVTDLWVVGIDGSGLTQLTSDAAADSNPRWSPDGKSLYFLSTRSGSNQVWRLADGRPGEAVQVTDLPLDVANVTISPDGSRIGFSLDVFPDCPTLACTRELLDAKEKTQVKARFFPIDGGFIRHWDTWRDGTRTHLFVAPLSGGKAGEPVDLLKGQDQDAPTPPFGGAEEYAFSPDGRTVVYAARNAGRAETWSTNFDLFEIPSDGSGKAKNLTAANPAWDSSPVFSPDGKTLAYLRMKRPGYESDMYHIVLRDVATGRERPLAEDWDRSPQGLLFSADGRTLYLTAEDVGQVPLFAIDVATGKVRKLVAEGHARTPSLAGDRLVYGLDSLKGPVELYTVRLDGTAATQITRVNAQKVAAVQLGEPEMFSFPGANGDKVYGWVVKPVGFQPGKKYPLAYLIHGGPQGTFNNEFHYRWNPQFYAGAGYAVLTVDFHGSTGYGQAFTDAIRNDWGGKPLEDLQKGLEFALQKYPWIDGDNACALGASYGGYMTNLIAGRWADRFRCLVTHDGMIDQRMMFFGTEELWFPEWEHEGTYWEKPENYEKDNPLLFADKWKTPMLVVHGGLDFRVPDNQGIGAFNILQRKGIPSQFLYFPDEGHWVLKPANSLLWHETVLAWLDRWLKDKGAEKPAS
jgi:dipeptidyl aminopeptidase/acylaminoacyl peptidase